MFKSFHNTAPNTLDNFKWSGFRESSAIPQHLKPIQPSFTNSFERSHAPMKPDFAGVYSKNLLNAPKVFQFTYDLSPMKTLNLQGKTPTLEQAIDGNNRQKYLDDIKTNIFTTWLTTFFPLSPPITPATSMSSTPLVPSTPSTSRSSSPPPLVPSTPATSRSSSPPPLVPSSPPVTRSSTPTPVTETIPVTPIVNTTASTVTVTPARETTAEDGFQPVSNKKRRSKKKKQLIIENDANDTINEFESIVRDIDESKVRNIDAEEEPPLGTDLTPFIDKFSQFNKSRNQSSVMSANREKDYARDLVKTLNKFISNPKDLLPQELDEYEKRAVYEVLFKNKSLFGSIKANEKINKLRQSLYDSGKLEELKKLYFKRKPLIEDFDDERTRHANYT